MSTETLVSELNQALDTLTRLHREIGTPYNQINDDKVALFQAISQLTNQHVHDLTTQRDTLRQQRDQALHQMAKLKRLMGDFVPHPSPPVTDHKSLNDQLADLKAQEVELKKGYDEKLNKVKTLHDKLRNYAIPLGGFIDSELLKEEKDIDVSLPKLTALEAQVKRCDEEFHHRVRYIQSKIQEVVQLWTLLDVEPQNEEDRILHQLAFTETTDNKNDLYLQIVSDDGMRYVRQRILQLDEIKQQREFRKNEISLKLIPLWQRLSIDQQQQEQFMAQHHGLTSNDLQEYESELERMIELKEKRIGDFIAGARKEIARLWSILYFSDDERREFGAAFTDEYSDELLEEHESQISKLQLLVEDRKYMLERVDRHMKLIEEIRAFKATTNDPSRLLTKSHRDPGRLLREEKFRKRVSRELPKVERELKGALQEHYVTHGSHFLVYGEPYIEKIGTENPWSTNNVTSRYMSNRSVASSHSSRSDENYPKTSKSYEASAISPRITPLHERPSSSTSQSPLRQPSEPKDVGVMPRRRPRKPIPPSRTTIPDKSLHQTRQHVIKKPDTTTATLGNRRFKYRPSDSSSSSTDIDPSIRPRLSSYPKSAKSSLHRSPGQPKLPLSGTQNHNSAKNCYQSTPI